MRVWCYGDIAIKIEASQYIIALLIEVLCHRARFQVSFFFFTPTAGEEHPPKSIGTRMRDSLC